MLRMDEQRDPALEAARAKRRALEAKAAAEAAEDPAARLVRQRAEVAALIPRALGTLAAQGYEGAGEVTFYTTGRAGNRRKVLETQGGWRLGVRAVDMMQLHLLLVSDGSLAQTFELTLDGDDLFSASVDERQRLTPESLGPEAVSVALTGLKRLLDQR